MREYIVLFSVLPSDNMPEDAKGNPHPETNDTSANFRQLCADLEGIAGPRMLGCYTDGYINFVAALPFTGDFRALAAELQRGYDENGASGSFQIVGIGDNLTSITGSN